MYQNTTINSVLMIHVGMDVRIQGNIQSPAVPVWAGNITVVDHGSVALRHMALQGSMSLLAGSQGTGTDVFLGSVYVDHEAALTLYGSILRGPISVSGVAKLDRCSLEKTRATSFYGSVELRQPTGVVVGLTVTGGSFYSDPGLNFTGLTIFDNVEVALTGATLDSNVQLGLSANCTIESSSITEDTTFELLNGSTLNLRLLSVPYGVLESARDFATAGTLLNLTNVSISDHIDWAPVTGTLETMSPNAKSVHQTTDDFHAGDTHGCDDDRRFEPPSSQDQPNWASQMKFLTVDYQCSSDARAARLARCAPRYHSNAPPPCNVTRGGLCVGRPDGYYSNEVCVVHVNVFGGAANLGTQSRGVQAKQTVPFYTAGSFDYLVAPGYGYKGNGVYWKGEPEKFYSDPTLSNRGQDLSGSFWLRDGDLLIWNSAANVGTPGEKRTAPYGHPAWEICLQ